MEVLHSNSVLAIKAVAFLGTITLFLVPSYGPCSPRGFSTVTHTGTHTPDHSLEIRIENEISSRDWRRVLARNDSPVFQNLGEQNTPVSQNPATEENSKQFGVRGVITTPVGNIYSRPTTGSSILEKLNQGNAVTLVRKKGEWYVVMLYDGLMGWAHEDIFAERDNAFKPGEIALEGEERDFSHLKDPFQHPSVTGDKLTLTVDAGRVRDKPSIDSNVKFRLKRGDTISILDTNGDWLFLVLEDGRQGWAHESLFCAPEQATAPATAELKKIEDVRFATTPEGKDKVVFFLNGNYPPQTFAIEEDRPRVVCDFFDTHLGTGIDRNMKVNGNVVRQIRIGVHKGVGSKVRVVLDLVPREDHHSRVRQMFIKDKNIFTLVLE